LTLAAVLVVAYLLGSIPTSYIVVYRFTGRDIRTMGSGNPGTMNVFDSLGWRTALLVAVGDISKGAAAVGLAYLVGLNDLGAVLAALCAVIGHDWSIFLRFDGGNGTAAVIGGMLALMPLATLLAAGLSIGIGYFVSSRRIAGLIGIALVPALGFAFGEPDVKLLGAVLLMAFTVLKIVRFEGFSAARPER
jgi:acyl phosphate:glycerol-3-phosphate acyltransferase